MATEDAGKMICDTPATSQRVKKEWAHQTSRRPALPTESRKRKKGSHCQQKPKARKKRK